MSLLWIPLVLLTSGSAEMEKPLAQTDVRPDSTDAFDLQGHRGARGLLPENTIPGFLRALELGVTTLEMDVAVTADSLVVLSHEPWFSSLICSLPSGEPVPEAAEEDYRIFEMTYAEVARFDCGRRGHPLFPEQEPMPAPKPLLRDVIRAAEAYAAERDLPDVRYNIETKARPEWDGVFTPDPEAFTRLLYGVLEGTDVQARATIQSFDPRTLQVARRLDPSLSLALLVAQEQEASMEEHLDGLGFTPAIYSPAYRLVDESLIEAAHERGMLVVPWTVNAPEEMERLKRLGVDGLITDYPDRFGKGGGEEKGKRRKRVGIDEGLGLGLRNHQQTRTAMSLSDDLSRRAFVRKAGLGALALGMAPGAAPTSVGGEPVGGAMPLQAGALGMPSKAAVEPNMIGAYGPWAASLFEEPSALPPREGRADVDVWRTAARQRLMQRLAQPEAGPVPEVTVHRQYAYDGLHVEELSWQLPYGPPTEAILIKPEGAEEPLPGVLGLHDHSGDKYFGKRKITKTADAQHPLMVEHQRRMYEGRAWANELARRGYAVLVPDAFAFASRRVRLEDVPEKIRGGFPAETPEEAESIRAYNRWASDHESILAKSLFCAGTTWPGVFLGEDQRALDVLCARADVDADRVGCCGLSGGGLRTVFLAGADARIRCAVCVGMMTTWRDYLLHKSHTHTWMVYVPLLPRELAYPEILGLRVPRPTLVLNNREDPLFTLAEMERADRVLQDLYARAEAGEHYRGSFYPGPHKFDRAMQEEAFDWLDRWVQA